MLNSGGRSGDSVLSWDRWTVRVTAAELLGIQAGVGARGAGTLLQGCASPGARMNVKCLSCPFILSLLHLRFTFFMALGQMQSLWSTVVFSLTIIHTTE